MAFDSTYGMPGLTAIKETQEAAICWGPEVLRIYGSGVIAAATVDAGNTPTTLLRPGLVLGKITASGKYTAYAAANTDGSGVAVGILPIGLRMIDNDGITGDRNFTILLWGPVKAGNLVGLDAGARSQLSNRFLFDDDLSAGGSLGGTLREVSKAADYTVVAADAGTLFAAITGAVTFTLPTIAAGLGPFEFLNLVDANMTIASAGSLDNIVWDQDLTVDSLAFSTTAHKIGGRLQVQANAAGTKWYVRNFSPATCTVTAA